MANPTKKYPGESRWKGWYYLLPAFLVYLLFTLLPILETIRSSFYQWDGFSQNKTWIGFANYSELFSDPKFHNALGNNLIFVIFYSIIPIMIGLFLASLLSRRPIPGFAFFRTALFLPQVISMVVVGVIWRWMFNPTFGPINTLLRAVGLDDFAISWLGDFTWALPAVGSIGTWVQYGFSMVLFLAGMQHIQDEYYEAASLDGANAFRQFIHITVPGLRSEIAVALVTTIITALRVFDLVYTTTRGGPGESTMVTGFLIYRAAFTNNRIGYAATIATVLTFIILIISLLIRRFQRHGAEENA